MKRRLTAVLAGGVIVAGISVAPATSALADTTPAINCIQNPGTNAHQISSFNANGVYIRTGPATSCTARGEGYESDTIHVHCIKGSLPDAWAYLTDNTTGVTGWSSTKYLRLFGGAEEC